MYAIATRRTMNQSRVQETRERAEAEFWPQLRAAPGFVSFSLIQGEDGVHTAVTVFAGKADADAFEEAREVWASSMNDLGHHIESVEEGEVMTHLTMVTTLTDTSVPSSAALTTTAIPNEDLPPSAAMMGLITGYWISQAIGVVARLGVADQLRDGPRRSDELAQAVGADARALYRVLRLLASIGVLSEDAPESFGLTPLGSTLTTDAPDSVRNLAIAETALGRWLPWGRLEECVRSGQSRAREALGMGIFDWYAQNPVESDVFYAAFNELSASIASELVRVYDVSGVRTVVDIGGGQGALLAAVLHANPNAHGILFELPHVIATANHAIAAEGLSARCELVSGDFFDAIPAGADLHILKQIVHDWDDERVTQLLTVCHRALNPAGTLLLVEMVIPAANQPSPAQAMDLNMLVLIGGRERTEDEYRALLGATGFRLERVISTYSPFSVIEATRV